MAVSHFAHLLLRYAASSLRASCGVNVRTIQMLIDGTQLPTGRTISRLASGLGMEADKLLRVIMKDQGDRGQAALDKPA